MACCQTEEKYGYEDSRFERDVDENFHCSICYNVLEEPRSCRNNDHMFCLGCITEHLNVNSQTCPECNEHLSIDTLRRPRVLNNYLSKLKISCDHASRGCPEFVCVEDLKTHVVNCGFAPVLCSNENCGAEINKQDKIHHENFVCEYRTVKCHDCGQIQEDVGALKGSLVELDRKVEAVSGKVQNSHVGVTTVVGTLKGSLVGLNRKVEAVSGNVLNCHVRVTTVVGKLKGSLVELNEKVEEVSGKVQGELKGSLAGLNGKVEAVRDEIKNEVKQLNGKVEASREETKKEIADFKESFCKVNKDVDEVKVMMSQMLEKLNIFEQLSKLPPSLNTPREDILIAGGDGPTCETKKSVEIYSWEKNGWFPVSSMNEEHLGASSFIYSDKLFVVGGENSKTIETLNLNELPLKWVKRPEELPNRCDDYQTVVYQQRVFHIGGYNHDEDRRSNLISELELTSLCTMKELCQMPEPRDCHRAEVVEDKVLILGGENDAENDFNSVLEFDPKTNVCRDMPPLPCPLTAMATVRWRDQVVVLGGGDEDLKVLNDVFMYDCKTGKITVLPSMLEERCGCCAVITGNTIVVMGGANDNSQDLNSVECFTMGGYTWEYLSAMNNARWKAVAEVLPSRRKYV